MSQFRVPDMHCDGCVRSLTKAIQAVDAAASVQVDLDAKMVRVDTVAEDAAVAAAIEDAGFTAEAA
jgi:copper chaperone